MYWQCRDVESWPNVLWVEFNIVISLTWRATFLLYARSALNDVNQRLFSPPKITVFVRIQYDFVFPFIGECLQSNEVYSSAKRVGACQLFSRLLQTSFCIHKPHSTNPHIFPFFSLNIMMSSQEPFLYVQYFLFMRYNYSHLLSLKMLWGSFAAIKALLSFFI